MIFKTANRYAFSKTHKQRRFSVLIILGIAFGLAALIIIIGIMNSLQTSQLSRLRNLESFDVSIISSKLTREDLENLAPVETAFNYLDVSAIAYNENNEKSSYVRIRGIDRYLEESARFKEDLDLFIQIPQDQEILLLGSSLASELGIIGNLSLKVTFLKQGKTIKLIPYTDHYFSGYGYYSANSEFSSSTCLISLDTLEKMTGFEESRIGLYLKDYEKLDEIRDLIYSMDPEAKVTDWKEANSSLYSALMLEKYLVIFFLAFIILIVSYYLKRATTRMIAAKRKEAAELRALGMSRNQVASIFIVQAFEICVFGVVFGIAFGLLFSYNLSSIFAAIDWLVRLFTGNGTILVAYPFKVMISAKEIILFSSMILICGMVFTLFGSREAFRINVMEILKDDTRN